MDIDNIREKVSSMYPGKWAAKVARMPDNQVLAIYLNMQERKQKKVKPVPKKVVERQMTIYDFL